MLFLIFLFGDLSHYILCYCALLILYTILCCLVPIFSTFIKKTKNKPKKDFSRNICKTIQLFPQSKWSSCLCCLSVICFLFLSTIQYHRVYSRELKNPTHNGYPFEFYTL